MNPFEIVGQLSTSSTDNWEEIGDKGYLPFMINRSFSYHIDTVMLANELNIRPNMPKKWQYDFYRFAIKPKKKRFSKWAKPDDDKLIEEISILYNVNKRKAISIRALLNPEDINILRESTTTGGR